MKRKSMYHGTKLECDRLYLWLHSYEFNHCFNITIVECGDKYPNKDISHSICVETINSTDDFEFYSRAIHMVCMAFENGVLIGKQEK